MFKKGDAVVYGKTGVCLIEDIVEKALIKNEKKQYYLLKPILQQNNVIYAPTHSEKVSIRPVMTKQQAEELIEKIPEITSAVEIDDEKEDYRSELESRDCCDLVSLTAKIYLKKKLAKTQRKKLGSIDEKYMRIGEDLLFGELSFVLNIPFESVQKYIEEKLKGKF